jgi:kynurenine aminotransferase
MDHDVMANHYSHPRGRPRLLKAISKHFSSQFPNIVERGEDLRMDEISVTAGANCGELPGEQSAWFIGYA